MRIALLLRAHDAEMAEAHRDFHRSAGVDVVLDGSPGVDGIGADWVIESEPNEFWWPRGGSLKEVLELIPARYGSVQALVRYFVPAPDADGAFADRMIYRLSPAAPLGDPWRPARRLVRRAGSDGPVLHGWFPIEVLRFDVGAAAPFTREALERARAGGIVHLDTRVRDALRAIAAGDAPVFSRPDVVDEAEYAADAAALGDSDVARTHARLDELERRLAAVESTIPELVKRKLRSLRRRSAS